LDEYQKQGATSMKLALSVLSTLGLFAAFAQVNRPPHDLPTPLCFYKAGEFIELDEAHKNTYVAGLMDGFLASGILGASDETVANLRACTKAMNTKQVSAIITKYVKDHPEAWHLPLSMGAYNALESACPGGF
jgi:hypothetical protein